MITIENEEAVSAATYIWIASQDRLAKEEWDFEEFLEEKLSRWTGRSDEFNESDSVGTGGRNAWNGGAVRNLV